MTRAPRDVVGWEVVAIKAGQKSPHRLSQLFTVRAAADAFLALARKETPGAYIREVTRVRGTSIC